MEMPDGCTQVMHDAAHRDLDGEFIRSVIEDRADDEIRTRSERFSAWLADICDQSDLQRFVSLQMSGDPGWFLPGVEEQLRIDYTEWRIVRAMDDGEADEIASEMDKEAW